MSRTYRNVVMCLQNRFLKLFLLSLLSVLSLYSFATDTDGVDDTIIEGLKGS